MQKVNINKITIVLNIIFLIIFGFYFFLNFHSINPENSINQKNKAIINSKLKSFNFASNISIEKIDLPELKKEMLDSRNVEIIKTVLNDIKKKKENLVKIKPIKLIKNNLELIKYKQNKNNNIKIKPIKHLIKPLFNKNDRFELIPIDYSKKSDLKNISYKINNNKKNQLIDIGKDFLNSKNDYEVEFLWPLNNHVHDQIYKILNKCLLSQTVLMNSKNIMYGLDGAIDRIMFNNHFSNIIRVPTNVYSDLEKTNIEIIKKQHLSNNSWKHLRLFKKNVDSYIMGYYLMLAQKHGLNINKIKGNYRIIKNKLYLDNLMINSKHFKNKIPLSSANKKCNI
jgi:hypothetical protein